MAVGIVFILPLLLALGTVSRSQPGPCGSCIPSSKKAPLLNVYTGKSYYPDLLEAGVAELVAGLES